MAGGRTLPIDLIDRNPRNPRRDFREDDLDELAASLKSHGIVQPIVVRPVAGADERYEIIAGERRWRAAQRAGLHDVPVTILDVSDREALELAIVENVQRADLNPIEEARGYQALIEEFEYSQGDARRDDRQEPRACDEHAAAAEAAGSRCSRCWRTGRSRPGTGARCSRRADPGAAGEDRRAEEPFGARDGAAGAAAGARRRGRSRSARRREERRRRGAGEGAVPTRSA